MRFLRVSPTNDMGICEVLLLDGHDSHDRRLATSGIL